MNCKSLFVEKTADHQDGVILSDFELVKYLTRDDYGVKYPHHNPLEPILAWFHDFFVRGKTIIRYRLLPSYYYETQQKWGLWRDTDQYIGDVMLACDCLYHMYIRHPELRDEKFQQMASRLGEIVKDTVKIADSSGFHTYIKDICSETALVPEQLSIYFIEKEKIILKPPPRRFFSITNEELFACLLDGLPNDIDAESSSDKKQLLIGKLKEVIKDRNLHFREKMMEQLEIFADKIKYQEKIEDKRSSAKIDNSLGKQKLSIYRQGMRKTSYIRDDRK